MRIVFHFAKVLCVPYNWQQKKKRSLTRIDRDIFIPYVMDNYKTAQGGEKKSTNISSGNVIHTYFQGLNFIPFVLFPLRNANNLTCKLYKD